MSASTRIACFAVSALLLQACGDAAPPTPPPPPPERGIFISASDCAASGKMSDELCAHAIDTAVAIHEQQAPAYKTLRQCTAGEGPERCEKTVGGEYRARLQAFLVIMTDPPQGIPLYPPSSSVSGFRQPDKQRVDAYDESLSVSVAALTVANENAKLPAPAAAADGF